MGRKARPPGEKEVIRQQRAEDKKKKILAAIPGSLGLKKNIAIKAGFSWVIIHEFFLDNPEFQALLDHEREQVLDRAEEQLYKMSETADLPAIKFLLSMIGKHRGYNPEDTTNSQPINISLNFSKVSKEGKK